VVICDLRMPGIDGFQTVALLCREQPPARILVLTNFEGDEDIFRAIQAGALGYLSKDADSREVLAAIGEVAAGKRYLPPAIAARLDARMQQQSLNARELQVLQRMSAGESNRQIARALELSAKTVEMYVTAILGKLGAHSRTDAVMIAVKRGLIDVK